MARGFGEWTQEQFTVHPKRTFASVLSVASLGALAWLAIAGSSDSPPSAAVAGLVAFVGSVVQLAAAWLFAESGKPPKGVVLLAMDQLSGLRDTAISAETHAEAAFEKAPAGEVRDALGKLGVETSHIRSEVERAGRHWAVFDEYARRELEED